MKLEVPLASGADFGRMTGHPEVETDGRGGATKILPGETEAGSAGSQPCFMLKDSLVVVSMP